MSDKVTGDDAGDRMILDQVLAGQKEVFRLLVERYERAVFAMGMSFFHNREEARDFVQDVFVKVYRNLAGFEGRSRFSTWLYRVAYNTAVNSASRRKDFQSLACEDDVRDEDTPERRALRGALRESVREAVAALPERYRVCVDLFFFYDRSYQEIEAITGYPVNTVKSHVFRAKKLLREKLEGLTQGGYE